MTPQQLQTLLQAVPDPEIPVLSISDLGILRDVQLLEDGQVVVHITPTYSGCPAMLAIRKQIEQTLLAAGVERFDVKLVLSPAWTTDWITEEGRKKLKDYGIAPPARRASLDTQPVQFSADKSEFMQSLFSDTTVACPRCDSESTQRISAFGSTACQEQWRCLACHEPFDHFKCH